MISIFFYGTLCIPEIFHLVTQKKLEFFKPLSATLIGFQTVYVENEIFPALKKVQTEVLVKGMLIQIEEDDLNKLWAYEGEEDYFLEEVIVNCEGELRNTHCFFPNNSLKLTSRAWTIEQWHEDHDFEQYLEKVKEWIG